MATDKKTMEKAYRRGVGIILVNKNREVFVGLRIDTKAEAWQMPQGGIDADETPKVAAMRELLEEVGTGKAKIIAESKGWYFYDLPEELAGKLWGGKYRGQKQKWFLMEFTGSDSDINIDTENPEFKKWQWVPAGKVESLIVPFKKELYSAVMLEFQNYFTNK